nr:isoform 2 of pre-mrna-splicing factor syf2 [Quercus suber]
MVKELKVRDEKRKSFSRRKFHEEKDIDSINDRNGHFNKKIERAFGAPKTSKEKIDRMVKELKDRDEKRKSFSRRRKFHEEKDIDSINDRNGHFNKKIERAFGRYTLEIKNSLERGIALPD